MPAATRASSPTTPQATDPARSTAGETRPRSETDDFPAPREKRQRPERRRLVAAEKDGTPGPVGEPSASRLVAQHLIRRPRLSDRGLLSGLGRPSLCRYTMSRCDGSKRSVCTDVAFPPRFSVASRPAREAASGHPTPGPAGGNREVPSIFAEFSVARFGGPTNRFHREGPRASQGRKRNSQQTDRD
jgi:hypothetical protein